jgi:aspartate carbamoyltransferase regulatory subunit
MKLPLDVIQNFRPPGKMIDGKLVPWSKAVQFAQRTEQHLKCSCCGAEVEHFDVVSDVLCAMVKGPDGNYTPLTRDHILPKSFGGTRHKNNIRIMCRYCNQKRGNSVSLFQLIVGATRFGKNEWGDQIKITNTKLPNQPNRLKLLRPNKLIKQLRCCGMIVAAA